VQRGGERIRLSSSLLLSRSSSSSHRHLAAFLVRLAGGGIKVGDEDVGSRDSNNGGAALRGGDSNLRGRGEACQLELGKWSLLTILLCAQE
jgi:hypothetical protein